jgi:hypothetical protein
VTTCPWVSALSIVMYYCVSNTILRMHAQVLRESKSQASCCCCCLEVEGSSSARRGYRLDHHRMMKQQSLLNASIRSIFRLPARSVFAFFADVEPTGCGTRRSRGWGIGMGANGSRSQQSSPGPFAQFRLPGRNESGTESISAIKL